MNLFFLPCAFLVAGVAAYFDGAAVHQLSAQSNDEGQIPFVASAAKPDKKKRIMDAISQFRAEICGKMKNEHGKKFASHDACEEFMNSACKPGKDQQMDGDGKEVTTQKGYCSAFFPEAKKKAEEKIDKEDKEEAEKAKAPLHKVVAAPSGAPAPAAAAPVAGDAPAPAPATAPASAPSPVPAPHIPGVSAGKPHGKIPDDEAYYYAKGGKSPDRLHMSEEMKLPDQGYWGKLVEHEDQKTATGDWGKEFGPAAGGSFRKVCEKHPDNPWCAQQGYRHRHHSSARPAAALDVVQLVLVALVAMRAF